MVIGNVSSHSNAVSTLEDKGFSTFLIRGEEVLRISQTADFQEKWQKLREKVESYSTLQSKGYIQSWYQFYKKDFEPVLCIGQQGNLLIGAMFLAWNRSEKYLVHAGQNMAEYHGWLAQSEFEKQFLRNSLHIIKKNFKLKKWSWRWMPPNTDLKLLKAALPKKMALLSKTESSPKWNLKNPEKLNKLLKSRSLKSKMKRFQRRGEVVYEVIQSRERLQKVLEQAKQQYDFRQEGTYGNPGFEKDPNKEGFTLALFDAGIVHASALWLNDRVLSFHLGSKDEKRVCLGMMSYDPTESKGSPGTLLLVELAKHLSNEGYAYLDLTPGTNSYKDRFANEYFTIHMPTIHFNRSYRLIFERFKLAAEKFIRKVALGVGITVGTLRDLWHSFDELPANIEKKRRNFSNGDLLKNFLLKKIQLKIYTINKTNNVQVDKNDLDHQKFESLLSYDDHSPFIQRRELSKHAIKKFSDDAELYSLSENGQLIWFGWLMNTKKPLQLCNFPVPLELEEGIVLGDFYFNSKYAEQELFSNNVEKMLNAMPVGEKEKKYLILHKDQTISNEIIKKWDIQLQGVKTWIRILYFFKFPVKI